MSKEVSKMSNALLVSFNEEFHKVTPYLQTLLPGEEAVERFQQMTHLAIMRDPNLLRASLKSLLLSLLWCAYRNMEPGVDDGVWLVPFKGIVTPIPSYKGLIKRAVETDTIVHCRPRPIYQGDIVEVEYGLTENLIHKPVFSDGPLIGATVVFTLPDGTKDFHIMYRQEIEKIRNVSAAYKASPKSGPWVEWEMPMFLKTVIKQGFRALPMKTPLRDLLIDDNRMEVGQTVESLLIEAGHEIPTVTEPEPEPEKINTSGFDKKVVDRLTKEYQDDPATYKNVYNVLQDFLEITASRQAKKMTVPQLKLAAEKQFDEFWAQFDKFLASKMSPPSEASKPEPPPSEEPEPPPSEEPEPEPPPSKASEPPFLDFLKAREELWAMVVDKMIPMEIMKKMGVVEMEAITEDNYSYVASVINQYTPSKKRKKG